MCPYLIVIVNENPVKAMICFKQILTQITMTFLKAKINNLTLKFLQK